MVNKLIRQRRKSIDAEFRSKGVDVDGLNKEFKETRVLFRQAVSNVKKRKFLGGVFFNPFQGFGRTKPEIDKEIKRLKELT